MGNNFRGVHVFNVTHRFRRAPIRGRVTSVNANLIVHHAVERLVEATVTLICFLGTIQLVTNSVQQDTIVRHATHSYGVRLTNRGIFPSANRIFRRLIFSYFNVRVNRANVRMVKARNVSRHVMLLARQGAILVVVNTIFRRSASVGRVLKGFRVAKVPYDAMRFRRTRVVKKAGNVSYRFHEDNFVRVARRIHHFCNDVRWDDLSNNATVGSAYRRRVPRVMNFGVRAVNGYAFLILASCFNTGCYLLLFIQVDIGPLVLFLSSSENVSMAIHALNFRRVFGRIVRRFVRFKVFHSNVRKDRPFRPFVRVAIVGKESPVFTLTGANDCFGIARTVQGVKVIPYIPRALRKNVTVCVRAITPGTVYPVRNAWFHVNRLNGAALTRVHRPTQLNGYSHDCSKDRWG